MSTNGSLRRIFIPDNAFSMNYSDKTYNIQIFLAGAVAGQKLQKLNNLTVITRRAVITR